MIRNTVYLSIPVMLLLLIIQVAVLPHLQVLNLTPNLIFVVALSWSLLRGIEEGIIWAFVGGFLLDLFTSGPIGATPLALMAAILVVAALRRGFPTNSFILLPIFAGLATIVYLAAYLVLVRLSGSPVSLTAVSILLPLILLHGLLMLPVYWLFARLERLINPRRVEL
jgi:rod shape-determining protein MreD